MRALWVIYVEMLLGKDIHELDPLDLENQVEVLQIAGLDVQRLDPVDRKDRKEIRRMLTPKQQKPWLRLKGIPAQIERNEKFAPIISILKGPFDDVKEVIRVIDDEIRKHGQIPGAA